MNSDQDNNTNNCSVDDARILGCEAYRDGKTTDKNPFVIGSRLYRAWEKGFFDAMASLD